MTIITIELSDERAQKLREIADRFGVGPEELARIGLEGLLLGPEEEFRRRLAPLSPASGNPGPMPEWLLCIRLDRAPLPPAAPGHPARKDCPTTYTLFGRGWWKLHSFVSRADARRYSVNLVLN